MNLMKKVRKNPPRKMLIYLLYSCVFLYIFVFWLNDTDEICSDDIRQLEDIFLLKCHVWSYQIEATWSMNLNTCMRNLPINKKTIVKDILLNIIYSIS